MHLQFIDLNISSNSLSKRKKWLFRDYWFKNVPSACPRPPCASHVYDARPYTNYKEERGCQIPSWPRASSGEHGPARHCNGHGRVHWNFVCPLDPMNKWNVHCMDICFFIWSITMSLNDLMTSMALFCMFESIQYIFNKLYAMSMTCGFPEVQCKW